MRDIRFRAWDKREKVWRYFDYRTLVMGAWMDINYDEHYTHEGQFTGLLDKSGKEIYEGDIVKHYLWGNFEIEFGKGQEGEPADFLGTYYGWCLKGKEATGFSGSEVEVIGDIYSNPELLK